MYTHGLKLAHTKTHCHEWENTRVRDTDDSRREAAPSPGRTTMTDRFILEKQGHVMWLRLNRPERLNAMTIESWGRARRPPRRDRCRPRRALPRARGRGSRVPRRTRRRRDPRAQRGHRVRQAHARPASGMAEESPEQHPPHPPGAVPGHRLRARLRGRGGVRGGVRLRSRGGGGVDPVRVPGG